MFTPFTHLLASAERYEDLRRQAAQERLARSARRDDRRAGPRGFRAALARIRVRLASPRAAAPEHVPVSCCV